MLRHIVLMTFKPGLQQSAISQAVERFFELAEKIEEVDSMEHGLNISREELHQGITHCFLMSFADEMARDRYLAHPEHKKFVSYIVPLCSNALVVDFAPSPAG